MDSQSSHGKRLDNAEGCFRQGRVERQTSNEKWSPFATSYTPLAAGSIDGTDTVPHDNAIYRAMCSKYKPNKGVDGNPVNTLFVGRLSPEVTESTLLKVFDKYGRIVKLRLIRDIVTGFSKGYAFVEYEDERSVEKAQNEMNFNEFEGKEILVIPECERKLNGWIPRRLGGGFGGKRESGQLRFGGIDRPFKKPIIVNSKPLQKDKNEHNRFSRNTYGRRSDNSDNGRRSDNRHERPRERSRSPRNRRYQDQGGRHNRGREEKR